jgi:oxygen-independent coproporphyrinogen III oxidase
MAGIYIHIPFCKQACNYCNFHFSTSLRMKNDFVASLLKEMIFRQEYLQGEVVETIYLGGGTPSLLPCGDLNQILKNLYTLFPVGADAEITLEANPDDIEKEKLAEWKKAGINRLSIGVQSFMEEELVLMNRAHNAVQALDCIRLAKEEGFSNISIDLIYGTANLSEDNWKKNVETAIGLDLQHLSCYALTVEPKTLLFQMIQQKKTKGINQDKQARQFVLLMEWMKTAGFEHYEISNFALPGKRSKHNASYWQGKKYLGLGPSAHSYDHVSRQWNIANNALYIESVEKNQLIFEKEELTEIQILNEYIMTSLRTMEGCDLSYILSRFGLEYADGIRMKAKGYENSGKLESGNERLKLTAAGKLLADGISADLFF